MYRRSTRHRLALAALLAASATVVTLDFRENPGGPIKRMQDIAVSVVAPLQEGLSGIVRPVGDFFDAIGDLGDLRKENAVLAKQIEQLKQQQRRFPEMVRENDRLKALTQEKDWNRGRKVGARVIGVGPSNHEWTAFLDKGAADGIRESMTVVSSEGLVGRVILVEQSYSKLLMVIDPQHSVGARLTNSGETGAITGRSQEDLRFELIEPRTKILSGETVVTSGYDKGIFPPGIPIGRVTRAVTAKDGLTKTAFVRPFVRFNRLDTVLVLLDSGPVVAR